MLGFLLSISACSTLSESGSIAAEPKEFFVSSGHPWSGQRMLRWEKDHLKMRLSGVESDGNKPIENTFRPSVAQWQEFWLKMDALGVWNWRSNYEPDAKNGEPIETEAPVWKVTLDVGNRKVDSLGKQVFPPDEKLIWRSQGYQALCKAINKLIGDEFCE